MSPWIPDLLLVLLGFGVLGLDLVRGESRKQDLGWCFHVAWMGLVAVFLTLFFSDWGANVSFLGSYAIEGLGKLFRQVFVLSALFTLILSRSYFEKGGDGNPPMRNFAEFAAIMIWATFGMFTVVSAQDLLTLFVGLELSTIPLYILAAFRKEGSHTGEASTKFIIMGALSTAVMLFGLSYLYGIAGGLTLETLGAFVRANPDSPMLWTGALLVIAALGFKMTLFPFHMWAPDVYHGVPTPVTAFLSVSSKSTAVAFFIILLYGPFEAIHGRLQPLILLLAGATMVVGNLGALKQRHLRRFMAYSSIAQAGYILMAMVGPRGLALSSIVFYLLIYGATNYAVFFIIGIIGEKRPEQFSSLRGLSLERPGLAAALAICMFSLAGIPPVAGFMGKFMLFASTAQAGFYYFVIFAALNSTVSLYYYLLVIKEAYLLKPDEGQALPGLVPVGRMRGITLGFLVAVILFLGIFPQVSTKVLNVVRDSDMAEVGRAMAEHTVSLP